MFDGKSVFRSTPQGNGAGLERNFPGILGSGIDYQPGHVDHAIEETQSTVKAKRGDVGFFALDDLHALERVRKVERLHCLRIPRIRASKNDALARERQFELACVKRGVTLSAVNPSSDAG